MKKTDYIIVALITMGIIITHVLVGCNQEAQKRQQKDQLSANEGLNRILTVYSMDGKVIKEYKGKFDIETDSEKVKFDIGNKRVIIYNCPVICEEVEGQ